MRETQTLERHEQKTIEDINQIRGTKALSRMIRWRRPANSKTERRFIHRWLDSLGLECDGYGNRYIRIGETNTMWSCHTDTVHREGGFQQVTMQGHCIILSKNERQSNCLGADDTAGVWLMREMILARKPGFYVFHRAEECGCRGADYFVQHNAHLLTGITMAIALDRKGYSSVITHQGPRTCSDEFAKALAFKLGDEFRPDDTGLFTDTACYTELIPECTNLSVGYGLQHSKSEYQDAAFLVELRDKLLALDTSDLPIVRDPKVVDNDYSKWWDVADQTPTLHQDSLFTLVRDYPNEVADLLDSLGVTASDVVEHIDASWVKTNSKKTN